MGALFTLLWNVVDRLFAVLNDQGFKTFGYADDIIIIVQDKFSHTVRVLMQAALNVVDKLTANEGLSFSPHKTAVVSFTNKRKLEGLGPLTLRGMQLHMLQEVKYLGVSLDSKLSWNQHVLKTARKAQTTFAVIRHTCGKIWGLRPNMVYWLYTRVIRPSVHYGALVWWPKAMQKPLRLNWAGFKGWPA
jgi:hypothetical protein